MRRHRPIGPAEEPTRQELAEIEREWPLIQAELTLLDLEIRLLNAESGPTALDRRRLRRATHQVLSAQRRQAQKLMARPADPEVA